MTLIRRGIGIRHCHHDENDAINANDENHFSPLITPVIAILDRAGGELLGSAPPCGSVIEKQEMIRLSSSGFERTL